MGARVLGVIIMLFALIVLLFVAQTQIAPLAKQEFLVSPAGGMRNTSAPATPPPTGNGSSTAFDPQPPQGFTKKDLSPYFGQVTIGNIAPGGFGDYTTIVLRATSHNDAIFSVTAWRMQGNRGSAFIPRAVPVYDPSGFAQESDITLTSGQTLTLYSTASALGKNVRLNKCMGYLENSVSFNPRLSLSCPYEPASNYASFSGICQDYIRSLRSCAPPADSPPVPIFDDACRAYLKTLNYRGCYDRHIHDKDFLSTQWVVWLGSKFLDERHDRVFLYDAQNLLVDEYTY